MTIDETAATFFDAFTNEGGSARVDTLYDICLAEAVIVNATTPAAAVYSLSEFVEPRRELLSSGRLVDFREYEVSQQTIVHDRIAHRTVQYEKSWIENGERRSGAGMKLLSFVCTDDGWKIASVLWQDRA